MRRISQASRVVHESEIVRIGTSSTSAGLISGCSVPCGMRSRLLMMRSYSLTSESSLFCPTSNCTVTTPCEFMATP